MISSILFLVNNFYLYMNSEIITYQQEIISAFPFVSLDLKLTIGNQSTTLNYFSPNVSDLHHLFLIRG